MKTGRRQRDRAGEKFAKTASEVGHSIGRVDCCLVVAGYDNECDLELAEEFSAKRNIGESLAALLPDNLIFLTYTTDEAGRLVI